MRKSSEAQAMNRFKSTLLIDPIGLISAEEPIYGQSDRHGRPLRISVMNEVSWV